MKEGLIQNDSKPNKRLRKDRVPKVKLEHFQEMEPCGRNYEPYGEIALSSHPQPTSDPHSKLSNTFPLPLRSIQKDIPSSTYSSTSLFVP
jgi:hypothetical protein